jgi:hypothetical protein
MAIWLPAHSLPLQRLGQEHGLVLQHKTLITMVRLRQAMNSEQQLLDRYFLFVFSVS